jgi:beta-glucosidase
MPDIQAILNQLTLEEKAALCTGASMWTTAPVERLGVPAIVMTDGPHGVRYVPDITQVGAKSLPATCFPTASCLASTWDAALLRQVGATLGAEAAALGVNVLLGPGANMKRDPRCGRNFEYYSEDPFLAGKLAAAFIQGVQSQGVGASLKHFAVNNQETERFRIDAVVDARALREIYLPAFETAVKEGKPWTVMCAYNKLNGVYCSEHHTLLVEILKQEWGFDGLVVSDWGAVHDRPAALQGGLDLEMPGPKPRRTQAVVEAVGSAALDEAALDEAVRRILGIIFRAAETPKRGPFDAAAHHAFARKVAGEGIVLLKNDGILPLRSPRRIAVIGRSAQAPHFQGGGSSHINPTQVDIPCDELQKLAGDASLTCCDGYPATPAFDQALIDEAVAAAQAADVALLFTALPAFIESEGYDRVDLGLTPQQVALIQAVCAAQPDTVVILNNGSALTMGEWLAGPAAVLEAWMMGQAGGGAIADVLFGKVNPSGKLAETFPLKLADVPAAINFPGGAGEVRYGEGIFIGYRYYDATARPVAFPFGYGLSYTSFAYSNPRLSAAAFDDVDGLTVSVDVTNTGAVAGKEIVQVYVHDRKSGLARPPKELKGFAKVTLQPGETTTVTIALNFRAFAYYHPGYRQWITEDGEFDILIGASAADIRGALTATLRSTLKLPCILNRESTVREWLADPAGRVAFDPMYRMIKARTAAMFGGGEEGGGIGMDPMGFMMEMPLLSLLQFQEAGLPMPAEAIVDAMLQAAQEIAGRS